MNDAYFSALKKYVDFRQIGEGTFVVYECRIAETGELIAMKHYINRFNDEDIWKNVE